MQTTGSAALRSIDEREIEAFLRLAYFPGFHERIAPIDFARLESRETVDAPEAELVRIGVEKLNASMDALWVSRREHLVPLSGGLDSRLILAALLERTEARRIQTYTFGVPGSYDYELGCLVAKEAKTSHLPLPLNGFRYDEEELLTMVERTWFQTVVFYHPPLHELDLRYSSALVWSGFVGDAVAGSHLYERPSRTLEEARRLYVQNRAAVRSVRLSRCSDADLAARAEFVESDALSWDERVLFGEAVTKLTAPLVLFKGFEYRLPFINSPWMDFMFCVPKEQRRRQRLLIAIGRHAYPRLFDLPSKQRLGYTFDTPDVVVSARMWANRVRKRVHQFMPAVRWPNVQFNDFNEAIRNSPDLREIVRRNLRDLERRGACGWVDFRGLWRRHEWRVRNHGDALIALASLELIFKAKERLTKRESDAEQTPDRAADQR